MQAGEISAGVLALLLLLIAGYAAIGRRWRDTEPVLAAGWAHRQAQSRYPTASPGDDPMLESFSAPMARPERALSQPVSSPRSDSGLFGPGAGRQIAAGPPGPRRALAPGGPVRAGGGPAGAAGFSDTADAGGLPGAPGRSSATAGPGAGAAPGSRQPPGSADGGSWQTHGPASRAMNRRPSVSGTPPWAPASPPNSDLPWTAVPGRRPGSARPAQPPGASAEQPWPGVPAQAGRQFQPEPPSHERPRDSERQPGWTPAHGRPDQGRAVSSPGFAQPAAPPGMPPPRTAGSGLPVRQPGTNAPRPLSPSGSLWEPAETNAADQGNDMQDPGSRPIYVWNPDPGAGE